MKDYFSTTDGRWNEQKLREVVVDEDVDRVLTIKLSAMARHDLMGWHYNEDGLYIL